MSLCVRVYLRGAGGWGSVPETPGRKVVVSFLGSNMGGLNSCAVTCMHHGPISKFLLILVGSHFPAKEALQHPTGDSKTETYTQYIVTWVSLPCILPDGSALALLKSLSIADCPTDGSLPAFTGRQGIKDALVKASRPLTPMPPSSPCLPE